MQMKITALVALIASAVMLASCSEKAATPEQNKATAATATPQTSHAQVQTSQAVPTDEPAAAEANAASPKLYLVAATLAMEEQPSGYPVTLYEVVNGAAKTVREIIPPYPDSGDDLSENKPAPTALGRVLASENAIYFIYPIGRAATVSILHLDNPTRVDDIQFNAAQAQGGFLLRGFTSDSVFTVISRSASEDELLIPILTGGAPLTPSQKVSLTSILVTSKQTQVTADSDAWGDYALQFTGIIGGPNPQTPIWGVVSGNNLVIQYGGGPLVGVPSLLGHALVLDEAPPILRGTQTRLWIWAANESYLVSQKLDYSANTAATTEVFVHDRVGKEWKTLQLEGHAMRLFGPWMASIGNSLVSPAQAQHPGRENERAGGNDLLPDVRGRYEAEDEELLQGRSLAASMPGVLVLYNLADGRKIRIITGQEDSEILDVSGDTVLYRVNDAIYTARILGNRLNQPTLLCKDDDVPEVHWAFWSK